MFLPPSTPVVGDSKFFEAAQPLAQSLSQWGLLIIGGSLVIIVSNQVDGEERVRAVVDGQDGKRR